MSGIQPIARIEAVKLPWTVAASASDMHLTVIENGQCKLSLSAFWGHHIGSTQYRRVSIHFSKVAASYYGMFRDDSERGGRTPLDWTRIFKQPRTDAQVEEWLTTNAATWESTGMSPDPKFYRVIGSPWIEDYDKPVDHFLICGSDAFIEVLAAGFEWREVSSSET